MLGFGIEIWVIGVLFTLGVLIFEDKDEPPLSLHVVVMCILFWPFCLGGCMGMRWQREREDRARVSTETEKNGDPR